MEKNYNVLCRNKQTDELFVVKVKATSMTDAHNSVLEENTEVETVQCVPQSFEKLYKRYCKSWYVISSFDNNEAKSLKRVQEIMDNIVLNDCLISIVNEQVTIESLLNDGFYICGDRGIINLWMLSDEPLTRLVEWVEEIAKTVKRLK